MWKRVISALAGALVACASQQMSLGVEPALKTDFSTYVEYLMEAFRVPGLSVAVVHLNKPTEFYNWGKSAEDGKPSNDDTLYSIASCSKAFLSASMGILIDDFVNGRNVTALPSGVSLDWKTKAKDLLPGEWGLADEYASERVSLLDMLSHITGMPRHDSSYGPADTVDQIVSGIRYLRPGYELREQWSYTNQMYMVGSYIISKYANQSYPSFVRSRIFDPLGMSHSTFYPKEAYDDGKGKLAQAWVNNAGRAGNETRRVPHFLPSWEENTVRILAGPGGVISSTEDLVHWVQTLLNKGKHPASGIQAIPSSALDTVMTGHAILAGKTRYSEISPMVYGAGWWRYSYQGHEIVEHNGGVPGFSSLISLLPNDGLAVVSLSNGDVVQTALACLTYRVAEDALALKRVNWAERYLSPTKKKTQKTAAATVEHSAEVDPVWSFAGTYSSPGYSANLTLCAFPPVSPSCLITFSDYATVDPDWTTSPSLYATWPRIWSSHAKLTRLNGTYFSLSLESVFPHGCGKDETPFVVARSDIGEPSYAEFAVGEDGQVAGLGLWGVEAGPATRVEGKVKESAEVWFDKVV